jgi:hypothetical protein
MVWNNDEDISRLQNGLRTHHYPWKSGRVMKCLGFFFMTSAADIDFLRISANPPGCTSSRRLRFLNNEPIFIVLQVFGLEQEK